MENQQQVQESNDETWTKLDFLELISVHDNKSRLKTYQYERGEKYKPHPPKAVIIYTHGLGAYLLKHSYIAKTFSDQGYDFVGYDSLGFGYSEGERGVINSFEDYSEDVRQFTIKVSDYYNNLYLDLESPIPIINYGYSLGARAALTAQRKHKLDCNANLFSAFVWQAPAFGRKVKDPEYLELLDKLCETEPNKIVSQTKISSIKPIDDPISFRGPYTARSQQQYMNIPQYLRDFYKEVTEPVFVALASNDSVVDNQDVLSTLEQFETSKDQIEIKFYESEHNILTKGQEIWRQVTIDEIQFLSRILNY
ncbi:UNKNOWN [Stylonychia lemnae]|uniref:Serine aminopeptidase S33 domain-containing protein n=1 Tax=Stylonychia lemnae TaxID=5949 RepID=A0A077ZZT8_STYLE|nr:UNKNOWN [Stylonychia lemnae]|eukprot:CDW75446.1 UNKNOWN [Stylonychia lemnae]